MHQPRKIPSEKFLLTQRLFTFLDEWLFYGVLILLYFHGKMEKDPVIFWLVVFLGGSFILVSYIKQWYMETIRFESSKKE